MRQVACIRGLVLGLFFAIAVFAQRDLGTIAGTVTDPTGAGIPNAKITITEVATNLSYTVTSSAAGEYVRPALKPGIYTVAAEAQGFRRVAQENVEVTAGDRIGVPLTLPVGNLTESIEVSANAPLLQTENTSQGADLNAAEVNQLPMGGQRVFAYLARLSPGVLVAEPGARDAQNGGFAANGVRSTGENNFLLNGVDNNVNDIDFINQTSYVIGPSLDAIGEMRILTNGYNAEYGRAAGGVVDVSLKSGTNQLHGSLFEYLQNTDLNANRWENNLADVGRPPLKQNQFGATAGGPIVKNKLFMFGDYQGTKIVTAGGVVQNLGFGGFYTIPTQAMVKGDFSGLLGGSIGTDPVTGNPILQNEIFDPGTNVGVCNGANIRCSRTPYPGNVIPTSAMDPAAAKIAALYPAPNQPIVNGNYPQNDYYAVTAGTFRTDQGDGRVDYKIDDKDSLFGSISWSDTGKTNVAPFQGALDGANFYGASEQDLGRNAQIGYTRIWSPTFISETRIAYSRLVTARTQGNANTDEFKAYGIGGLDPTTTLNGGLPQFGMGNYSQIGANDWLPTKEYSNVYDFIQNVAITKGSHAFKFGAEVKPIGFPFFQVPFPHGEMNFSRTETGFPSSATDTGKNGTLVTDTGDDFASFLLGAINNGQISTTNFISSKRQSYDFYAQDDWKVTPKLTINYGLRYELWSPIGESFGRQSNFNSDTLTLQIPSGPSSNAPLPPNFNTPYTLGGVTFPADFPNVTVCRGCVSKYLIPWDKHDFGPRLGFAYNIRQKTVIRAAFGIFYGGEEQQGGNPNRGESAPFNESPQLNRPNGVGGYLADPYFANGAATGGIAFGYPATVFTTYPVSSLQFREVSQDFRNPMVQKWNIAVQQELGHQMALELGYQGNHSSHQLFQPDDNPYVNDFTTASISQNSLRAIPYVGFISGTSSFGYGDYKAFTAKLEKHLSAGLQFISSYTLGKAMANTGTTLSGSNNFQTISELNYGLDYSPAAWDIRQNFTTGFTYDLPFGRGKQFGGSLNKAVDIALGNWQVNGILTLHTGQPYTVSAGSCQGVWSGCFPDIASGVDPNAAPSGGRTPSEWFNTSNFSAPAAGTQGTIGDNRNYGPPLRNLDLSVFKEFPFTERFKLQFRTEVFNLTNTPQFNFPDSGYGDSKFGQVTSTLAGTERHVQFSLKLLF